MSTQSTNNRKIEELREKDEESKIGGGQRRIDAQHAKGKLTARERISLLLDEGTFEEVDKFITHQSHEFGLEKQRYLGDSVVTGSGQIMGRTVWVYSQDFTVIGGSLSKVASQKICKIMDQALNTGAPVIGLIDSGGARIQEGVDSLSGYSDIFQRNVISSGVIPQISAVFGPGAGGASYSPALTDYVMMVKNNGQLYITGPDVIKAVTGEEISHEDLGGALSHSVKSGVTHLTPDTEEECIEAIRRLIQFLPQNNMEMPPDKPFDSNSIDKDENMDSLIPDSPSQGYNILDIITKIVDNGDFMEIHESFARNIVVGHARIGGKSVGIVANQPDHMAGVLDIDASDKGSRFVRLCDSFNIPVVTLIDVPGFMPGSSQEHGGIIRHGAKLIYAYAEATVPKISILTRKAYGGAYIVMSSKNLKGDLNYAWPTGEIAVMGADSAVNIIHRNEIKSAEDPEQIRKERLQEYSEKFMNPYVAASRGLIDDVIEPSETRQKIIRGLDRLQNKRTVLPPKKHGNIPL